MFDKLLENVLAQYMLGIAKMSEAKRAELEELRAKVRTCPEEVEAWFDKEIDKLSDKNIKDLIQNLKDNGPAIMSLESDSNQ